MGQEESAALLRKGLLRQLGQLEKAGVRQLPPATGELTWEEAASADFSTEPASSSLPPSPDTAPTETPPPPAAMPARSPAKALEILSQQVAGCTLCSELAAERTQTVFGVGDPKARLCFFGEAPGADEDRQGEPFVGRAGRLLTDIIEKGMKLTRDDVYILNVLKCRPPGNRNPSPDEAANCRLFFEKQLEIIKPEFICCLGSVAAKTLLETEETIGRLRGRFHDWRGVKVLATYHPAYLLRNPSAKAEVWKDIQILMAEMGLEVKK